ncbi:GGDEF domain-containing protein [Chitinibacter fontanus]|uniref:GGDEF domain-containing protein n=1 Tax=Chitinibacter fontanus TaxID=1737446 RepID=A0A7D5ZLK9_9NEIS|nr:GGDEF domain-containing protein [Chitinibacter fontanus]QLI82410.1 GGDEF domain-containing protein [Chitinibacter fontanus]
MWSPSTSEPSTVLSLLQPLDPVQQRHSARIKRERRWQRQRLALGLACLSLLSGALWLDAGGMVWPILLLPLGSAAVFFYASFALRRSNSEWEWRTSVLAIFIPPLFTTAWAWMMREQLPASSLVLPFVLQPMLLLLAGLPLLRYVAATLLNLLLITAIIASASFTFLPAVSAVLVVVLATVLGINTAQHLLQNQQRMLVMRQRVAENAEKMAERNQKMRKLAFEDPLTGLANRLHLINQLRQTLKNPLSEAANSVVFLIDLDFFKTVNDQYGHAAGDALLIEIAQRFKALVRRGDLVCRLGGDEFVILVRGLNKPAEIITVADKILAKLSEPVWYQQQQLPLGGSIGIAPWLPDLRSPASWLKSADEAMYQAKVAGRNRYVIADFATQARSDT